MTEHQKAAPHSAYQVLADAILLVGNFAKLSATMASNKLHTTSEIASNYIHSKVEMPHLGEQFAGVVKSVEEVSDYASHTDLKHIVDDVGAFTRKHPVTSLLTAVAVGAIFSRLMRVEAPAPAPVKIIRTKAKTSKGVARPRRKANGAAQAHAKA